jgi:signal transduction histidine kinase
LLRALRNLAGNAIEWSPPGSRVQVQLEGKNGEVIVTVDDQGPGVPPELRTKIFEPFFTGPQQKGRRVGYGLGLAIVRAAAVEQGGTIEVGTSDAGGARFRLVLPKHGSQHPN